MTPDWPCTPLSGAAVIGGESGRYHKTGSSNLLEHRKQCMNDTDVSPTHDAEARRAVCCSECEHEGPVMGCGGWVVLLQ
jgi:hypothetical protein